jgi:hypothetical protein
MADAPAQAAYTQLHPTTAEERVAASRVVLAHATSREDLHELLDALGLNTTQPREEASAE